VIGSYEQITSYYRPEVIGSNEAITTEVMRSNEAITTGVVMNAVTRK
jgi:hypothetical protein